MAVIPLSAGTKPARVRRLPLGRTAMRALIWLLVVAGALTMVLPFLWMVSTSLKTDAQAFLWPPKILPWPPQWQNYRDAWQIAPFGRFFFNSAVVSFSVMGMSLLLNSLAAFGFAKYQFRGAHALFIAVLATMMIPGQITMIPCFLLMKHLGWLDSYAGLTVPGFASAFGIFFLRQFMITIPGDYMDAARMDGASELAIWWRIITPLAKPALATLSIFTFLGTWNDFLWPLIVVKSDEMRTLPLAISALSSGHYVMSWPLLMAGACFVVFPVLIVYIFAQRFLVEGIALGGIKG
ncbi:MAG TPA: carbohydrate ABC transporter permease [Armatimonadota bacterium]